MSPPKMALRQEPERALFMSFDGYGTFFVPRYDGAQDKLHLTFVAEPGDYGAGFMEPSASVFSADDIAALRARRILLNEQHAVTSHDDHVELFTDSIVEVLIRGMNTPLQVTSSPLPGLFADVDFDGQRPKKYTNAPASRVHVEGVCLLREKPAADSR